MDSVSKASIRKLLSSEEFASCASEIPAHAEQERQLCLLVTTLRANLAAREVFDRITTCKSFSAKMGSTPGAPISGWK